MERFEFQCTDIDLGVSSGWGGMLLFFAFPVVLVPNILHLSIHALFSNARVARSSQEGVVMGLGMAF